MLRDRDPKREGKANVIGKAAARLGSSSDEDNQNRAAPRVSLGRA